MLARAVIVAIAAGAIVLLAADLRSVADVETGVSRVAKARGTPASGPRAAAAWDAYHAARRFRPEAGLLTREAGGRAILGDLGTARRLARRAARLEPSNFQAWFTLYLVSNPASAQARRARRRAIALDPRSASRLKPPRPARED